MTQPRTYLAENGRTLLCRGCNQKALSETDDYHDECIKRFPTSRIDQELLDKIDSWHDGDSIEPLHSYLGWTWEQYKHWVETDEQPS